MNIRMFVMLFLCLALGATAATAQTESTLKRMSKGKMNVPADELVSFKADVPYGDAVTLIGEISKRVDGKILIDRTTLKDKGKTIGINIESMYWKDALELILRNNSVWYNEFPEYREIISLDDAAKQSATPPGKAAEAVRPAGPTPGVATTALAPVDSSEFYSKLREITVSSIFFEVDLTKLTQVGLRLNFLRGRDMNLGMTLDGTGAVTTPIFSASIKPTGPADNPASRLFANVDAGLAMLESNQLGEIIARPQASVRSGSITRIQIGQDFSTREKDFSGNIVEKFYSTGTILTVKPRLFHVGDFDFIDLVYEIERSSPQIGATSTIINKTVAKGSLSLLPGEEGYVGGMYSNEITATREGIPGLKDLPWWVFGLRYLFGYDGTQVTRKELIVLIKADLLPLVEDRAARPRPKSVLEDKVKELRQDFDRRTTMKDKE